METEPITEEGYKGIPRKLTLLRQKLNEKAVKEPKFKFYTLYEKIYREDVIETAWKLVKKNKGAAGVDKVTIEEIERRGVSKFLEEIRIALKERKYKASAVKRVYIPKANGKMRPLGIPTIKDRIVQMATLLIIEPIYESDFEECSYGFRRGRSAHEAIKEIKKNMEDGLHAIYDADLKGYFDTIPHDKLLLCVMKRIVDKSLIKLIRMWLRAPIVESGKDGKPKVSRNNKGTPQGGVISPILSNMYLHHFDSNFHNVKGAYNWAKARLVRYADDFVVMAKYQSKRLVEYIEGLLEGRMELEINREKTKIINMKESSLDFLGFTFRYDKDLYGRKKKYLNIFPSKKSVEKEKEKIRELTSKKKCFKPIPEMIKELNENLRGWENYFGKVGHPRKEFRKINSYTIMKLTKHLKRRSQRPYKPPKGMSYYKKILQLNLKQL